MQKNFWERKKISDKFAKKPLKIYKNGPKYFQASKEVTFISLSVEFLDLEQEVLLMMKELVSPTESCP